MFVYYMDQTFYDILVHLSAVAGFSPKLHHSSSLWMRFGRPEVLTFLEWECWHHRPKCKGVCFCFKASFRDVSSQVTVHIFAETLS